MKTTAKMMIRRMRFEDAHEVLQIEWAVFPTPWRQEEFEIAVRTKSIRTRVLLLDGKIIGYAIWQFHRGTMWLENIAVHAEHQRRGIGRILIENCATLGHPMATEVRERNLGAQLFLRKLGFLCTEIKRRPWENSDEDAYIFQNANVIEA
jgi:[ribosomal protein S18]-alanine N-acetyltransferase